MLIVHHIQIALQVKDIFLCGPTTTKNLSLTKSLLYFQALPSEYLPNDIMEPGKLDEFFDKMDASNDGQLSYEEFAAAMQTDKFLMDALLKPTNKQGLANGVAA